MYVINLIVRLVTLSKNSKITYNICGTCFNYSFIYQLNISQYFRIIGNDKAFKQAQHKVIEKYSVVGLIDQMQESLRIMEKLLPKFMEGANSIYLKTKRNDILCSSVH